MSDKDTEQLQHELSAADTMDEYFSATREHLLNRCTLSEHLSRLLDEKNLCRKDVIERSGLDEIYAYHIFAGRSKKPSRKKVLALALAMELTPKETQNLLYYAGVERLYVRIPWDSIIWHALEQHLTVSQANHLLDSLSETEFLE